MQYPARGGTRIDWNDLRLVVALGEAGTLKGAARRIGVDHSTAFRRLNALESRLGVRLFERARDGYSATVAGERCLVSASRVLDDLDALHRQLAGEDLRPSGTVRVTTTDTLVDFLAPLIAEFRRLHDEIEVELVTDPAFFTLTHRDADIAIRPTLHAPENLAGRRIATIATAPYTSRTAHSARGETPTRAGRTKHGNAAMQDGRAARRGHGARTLHSSDAGTHDWIGFDERLGHLASARWMRSHVDPARIRVRCNSLNAAAAMARAGVGWAALPCYLGDADEGLIRAAPPVAAMDSALWLLVHPDLRRVARIRAFLDFMADRLAARSAELEGRKPRTRLLRSSG